MKVGTTIFILAALACSAACHAGSKKSSADTLPDGWKVHDPARPAPANVRPGSFSLGATAPSDAVILFDGSSLAAWRAAEAPSWSVTDGVLSASGGKPTLLKTKQSFGDIQLHLEFREPSPAGGESQERGNSGVFLMGMYEVQIVDTFKNKTYADGWLGALFGQKVPLADVPRPAGEWQSYDIIFNAPRFDGNKLTLPAFVTVLLNGVVVQNHEAFLGQTEAMNPNPAYSIAAAQGPLALQEHGDATGKVQFRNIWVRPLKASQ